MSLFIERFKEMETKLRSTQTTIQEWSTAIALTTSNSEGPCPCQYLDSPRNAHHRTWRSCEPSHG